MRPVLVRLCVLLTVLGAFLLPAPALAHAGLVASDPESGSVLEALPEQVRLTFAEPVTPLEGNTLFTPDGVGVAVDPVASGDEVLFDLTDLDSGEGPGDTRGSHTQGSHAQGSHALAWRVLSADGHVVRGTVSFAVGFETTLAVPDLAEPEGSAGDAALAVVTLLGLLVVVGLAASGEAVRRRAGRIVCVAGGVTAAAAVGQLLLAHRATGLWVTEQWWAVGGVLGALALAAGAMLRPRGRGADVVAGASLVAAGLGTAVVGHTRGVDLVWLAMLADVVHVVAGAVWFGGLLGLCLVLRDVVDDERVLRVQEFSRRAGWALVAVSVSGLLLAVQVLGEWTRVFTTDHGRVLLVKVALVLVAVGLGAWHRRGTNRPRRWRRTLAFEVGVLAFVVVAAGVLSQASPSPTLPERVAQVVEVGDDLVEVALVPGVVGVNRVELRVRDERGLWIPLADAPEVSLTAPSRRGPGGRAEGQVGGPMREVDDAWTLSLALARAGDWTVQVPLQFSRYGSPVVAVTLPVVERR